MLNFKGRHFPADLILMTVRWKLAYPLSYRDIEEVLEERGADVDQATVHRRVIRLMPLPEKVFRRHKRPVDRRWCMDETYIKIRGQWKYLYRAVDSVGLTVDFLLAASRDKAAALLFFRKAIRQQGEPEVATIDKSGTNTAALADINKQKSKEEAVVIRRSSYLNNPVEQDHRNIRRRARCMMRFKSFRRYWPGLNGYTCCVKGSCSILMGTVFLRQNSFIG